MGSPSSSFTSSTDSTFLGSGYLEAYLAPPLVMPSTHGAYDQDTAAMIAGYCLDALGNEPLWRGREASRLTKELREHVAAVYGDEYDRLDEE